MNELVTRQQETGLAIQHPDERIDSVKYRTYERILKEIEAWIGSQILNDALLAISPSYKSPAKNLG